MVDGGEGERACVFWFGQMERERYEWGRSSNRARKKKEQRQR